MDDNYTVYEVSGLGCLGILAASLVLWCLLIYGSYNLVAWVLHGQA